MSDRFTSIKLPGVPGSGLADWGRKTPEEMIAYLHKHCESQIALYTAMKNAFDADYRIETYVGVHVQRNKEVLQPGRPRRPLPETGISIGEKQS